MAEEPGTREAGNPAIDRLFHTMVWSAFAARRFHDTDVLDDRYHLYSPQRAMAVLWPEADDAERQPGQQFGAASVRWWLGNIAVWAASVRMRSFDSETQDRIRRLFSKRFGFEFASMRLDADRTLLPNLLELGIQDVSIQTESFRRSVRVHVEAVVRRPFPAFGDAVFPSRWGLAPFWRFPAEGTSNGNPVAGPRTIDARIWLPGGMQDDADKSRHVLLRAEVTRSPFANRIDYSGEEVPTEGGRNADIDSDERFRKEVGPFSGYLGVEKLEGRPGWCRAILDRRASFGHINHDFLCKETLWYWLLSDLIGIVAGTPEEAFAFRGDGGTPGAFASLPTSAKKDDEAPPSTRAGKDDAADSPAQAAPAGKDTPPADDVDSPPAVDRPRPRGGREVDDPA